MVPQQEFYKIAKTFWVHPLFVALFTLKEVHTKGWDLAFHSK